jgi:hypothetical protein
MADQTVIHIEGDSPEYVAYKLMQDIANVERRALNSDPPPGWTAAGHPWILGTYRQCLEAVRSVPSVSEPPVSEPPISEPPVSEPPVSEPPGSDSSAPRRRWR